MSPPAPAESSRFQTWIAAAIALLLAVWWIATIPSSPTWGWDESMHAELPAARIALLVRAGEFGRALDVVAGCAQYPPVWPLVLALPQLACGVSEPLARATCMVLWALTVFGVYLLTRELVRGQPQESRARFAAAPWIALGLTALLPMPLAFAGTTFLEVPSACVILFAVRAWIVRDRRPGARSDLLAGVWLAAAVFTKWNYGILLVGGLGLAASIEFALALRRGAASAAFTSLLRCTAPLAVVSLWWFVLPWPLGSEIAGAHRDALAGFIGGNLGLARAAAIYKVNLLVQFGACSPFVLLAQLVGFGITVSMWQNPAVRVSSLGLLALAVPIELHPFHLERFLIPWLPLFGVLGVFGWMRLHTYVFIRPRLAGLLFTLVLIPVVLADGHFGPWIDLGAPKAAGSDDPNRRAIEYRRRILCERRALPRTGWLPTGGLARSEFDALLDPVAREVGPAERVAWIGLGNELSPAAVHLRLLERGGSIQRFLDAPYDASGITYFGADPSWNDEQLLAWAEGFDVIFWTDPIDLKDRANRRFLGAYTDRLLATGRYTARSIGSTSIERGLAPALSVTLFACRRKG